MHTDRIAAAFAVDPDYMASCLAQRQPGQGGAGSRFIQAMTLQELVAADWQPYEHPAVAAPAVAFVAPIPGTFGLIRLADLPADTEVTLDDRKGVGQVMPVVQGVQGPQVDFTVLLLGPTREDPTKECVWTFFPGEPISPSQVPATGETAHGTKVTAAQAIELGLEWAKIE